MLTLANRTRAYHNRQGSPEPAHVTLPMRVRTWPTVRRSALVRSADAAETRTASMAASIRLGIVRSLAVTALPARMLRHCEHVAGCSAYLRPAVLQPGNRLRVEGASS